jgi:hypothetical protein
MYRLHPFFQDTEASHFQEEDRIPRTMLQPQD